MALQLRLLMQEEELRDPKCGDGMDSLARALARERFRMPCLEEVRLSGARWLSPSLVKPICLFSAPTNIHLVYFKQLPFTDLCSQERHVPACAQVTHLNLGSRRHIQCLTN